jgi:hypothetical protein
MIAQHFSIGVTAILAAPVGVMNASRRWLAQVDGHLKGADREILSHAIAHRPANHTPGIEVENNSKVEPSLAGPDVRDITGPFLVGRTRREVLVEQVRRDVEPMIAVGRCLVFARAHNTNAVIPHQSADTPMTDGEAQLLELFRHAGAAVTAQRQIMLLANMRQNDEVRALALTHPARPPGAVAPRCDLQHAAQLLNRPDLLPDINESKSLHFWLAKKAFAKAHLFLECPAPPSRRGSRGEVVQLPSEDRLTARYRVPPSCKRQSTCPASKAQSPNPQQPASAKGHCSTPDEPPRA